VLFPQDMQARYPGLLHALLMQAGTRSTRVLIGASKPAGEATACS